MLEDCSGKDFLGLERSVKGDLLKLSSFSVLGSEIDGKDLYRLHGQHSLKPLRNAGRTTIDSGRCHLVLSGRSGTAIHQNAR